MAYEIASKDTLLSVDDTSITAELPDGDHTNKLMLACVIQMWGGGSNISETTGTWTLVGTQAFTAFCTHAWFWKIGVGSDADPVFENTNPGAREWFATIRIIDGFYSASPKQI